MEDRYSGSPAFHCGGWKGFCGRQGVVCNLHARYPGTFCFRGMFRQALSPYRGESLVSGAHDGIHRIFPERRPIRKSMVKDCRSNLAFATPGIHPISTGYEGISRVAHAESSIPNQRSFQRKEPLFRRWTLYAREHSGIIKTIFFSIWFRQTCQDCL